MSQNLRLPVFDNIKFILIVLVIYCHLINVGLAVPWKVYQIIYSFHMPLFVLISGFFTNKDKPPLKFWDQTLNFGLLFIVFNLVTIYIYIYLCDKPPVDYPYVPSFALWYLLCMIYWRTMIWCIPDRILKSKFFFISVLCISVIPSIWYVNYLAVSRFLSFAPYFLIGWYLRNTDIVSRLSKLKVWQKSVVIAGGVISCFYAIRIPTGIFWGYEPLSMDFYQIIIFKVSAWVIAIVNSMTLFIIVPKTFSISEGRHTLAYYLLHTLILFPVVYYIAKLLPQNYFITVMVLLITLGILALLRRINWIDKALGIKPIETVMNHMRKNKSCNTSI